MRPVLNPAQSVHTSSCPSTWGPAPTPMVGIFNSWVTRSAASAVTISSTTANAPASSTAWASATSCSTPVAAALDDVAAQAVLALRREADVRHHRDARGHDAADLLGAANPALELHGVGVRLFHEAERGVKRFVGTGLVGSERHVGDDERAFDGSCDRAGQRNELIHGHRERGVEAEHVVAGGVADQQKVDAGLVEDLGAQLVVAGQAGDLGPGALSRSGNAACAPAPSPTGAGAAPGSVIDATVITVPPGSR